MQLIMEIRLGIEFEALPSTRMGSLQVKTHV